jgi:predicted Ser/Thr protein kinase
MGDTVNDFKLLQASVDPDEGESDFRILVDGKFVKYLTIDPKLYSADDMCFEPTLNCIIPPLPPGDWNTGRISLNCADGRPHFSEVKKVELPGVTHLWHPLRIDHLDLHMGREFMPNVYEATTPQFDLPILVKFATFPYEIHYLDSETSAYQWLQNHQIGPQFLGHLTEEGRVIGFAMERITNFRHATPDDLALCQQALSKLHRLNIKHGDINKHNFLIHDDRATLIDFESALQCNNAEVLEEEFRGLEKELSDMSGRGGRTVRESGAE